MLVVIIFAAINMATGCSSSSSPSLYEYEDSPVVDSVTVCSNGKEKQKTDVEFARTALDEYVWRIDGAYNYTVTNSSYDPIRRIQTIKVNFTSQEWLKDVDWHTTTTGTKVWWHWLVIYVPLAGHAKYNEKLLDTAMVLIDGGDNDNMMSEPSDNDIFLRLTKLLAQQTGSVTAVLKNIPHQYCSFAEDWKDRRREDDLIAYTWARYMNESGSNPEVLLLMPMVKAAVLSFNATSDIVQENHCGPRTNRVQCRPGPISRFFPTGGSKRGWTTWLAGAVDHKRVKGMAPIVLSFLNMVDNFHHYWRAYGGWSFAMAPYYNEGITKTLDEPINKEAMKIFDPYVFRDRLTMPKLVISTAGDEFFMPDDSHYWLGDMSGPTMFRLLPNAEHATVLHSLTTKNYMFAMRHVFLQTMLGHDMPDYCSTRYKRENGVKGVKFMTNDRLRGIHAFVTDTRDRQKRDYRLIGLDTTSAGLQLKPINLTHFEFNPYTYENEDDFIPRNSYKIQPNLWSKFPAKQSMSPEYKYEYFVELDPAEVGYRAMLLNAQFMGSVDDLGWIEVTSEVQFTEDDIDPFNDCYAESCYGTLV